MVVMWDVDGVLANFNKAYVELVNQMFDTSFPILKPPTWDYLEEQIGKEKNNRVWDHIKQSQWFWENLEPLATDRELERIADLEATQYFVTSRVGRNPKFQTELWLENKLGYPQTVIISNRKADAANAVGANYTIDDKVGNVLATYYSSPTDRKVYVFDAPYNQFSSKVVGSRVRRVTTVTQFLDDIEAGK